MSKRRYWTEREVARLGTLIFQKLEPDKRGKFGFIVSEKSWKEIRHTGFAYRTLSAVKTKAYKKGGLSQIRQLKTKPKPPEEKEPEKIYRFLMALAYQSKSGDAIEYRVWTYSNIQYSITEQELEAKFQELIALYPTNALGHFEVVGLEIGEQIEKEEIEPSGADYGEWLGYANFNDRAVYFARSGASQWLSPCAAFKVNTI